MLALLLAAALLPGSTALAKGKHGKGGKGGGGCKQAARRMYSACQADVKGSYDASRASCLNFPLDERGDCLDEARETRADDRDECGDQRDARNDACDLLGEDRYDTEPLTDPNLVFVDPDTLTTAAGNLNPFFSLEAGHTYVLRAGTDFEETDVVHVTDQVREILGQPCRVVTDAVVLEHEDGGAFEYEPSEITDDSYAQTDTGDVYYCGEVSRVFEDGVLRSLEGSFEAGFPDDFGRAKSGVLIKAAPAVGDTHRQEFLLGEAEDLVTYLDTGANVPDEEGGDDALAPAFRCDSNCLKTREFNPNEPSDGEFKYYRSGIGQVLGVTLEDGEVTGERDELLCSGDSLAVLTDPSCGIGDPAALEEMLCKVAPDAFCD